jgi:hypothetical protein
VLLCVEPFFSATQDREDGKNFDAGQSIGLDRTHELLHFPQRIVAKQHVCHRDDGGTLARILCHCRTPSSSAIPRGRRRGLLSSCRCSETKTLYATDIRG